MAALLKIGEVCDLVGLSLRTVRYYEEVGLLTPASRSPGGFRLYSDADVRRLRVLKGMKPLGLTLDEIRELMSVLDRTDAGGDSLSGDVADTLARRLRPFIERADQRVKVLEGHIAEVRRLRDRMTEVVETLGS